MKLLTAISSSHTTLFVFLLIPWYIGFYRLHIWYLQYFDLYVTDTIKDGESGNFHGI